MSEEIYCLWGSCKKFDPENPELCNGPDRCFVTGVPAAMMTLEEAKKKYPDTKFCKDWEAEEEDE